MKRTLYHKLVQWKNDKNRKPLVLRGARQTGKTYLLQEFGVTEWFFFKASVLPQRIAAILKGEQLYFPYNREWIILQNTTHRHIYVC